MPELITGKIKELAAHVEVNPIRIPGYWIHKQIEGAGPIAMGASPSPNEKVLLFLHGGAYVLCSGHTNYVTTNIAKGILKSSSTVTLALSLEYRLSALPHRAVAPEDQNPFPAALLDALQGYWYLVKVVGYKE